MIGFVKLELKIFTTFILIYGSHGTSEVLNSCWILRRTVSKWQSGMHCVNRVKVFQN